MKLNSFIRFLGAALVCGTLGMPAMAQLSADAVAAIDKRLQAAKASYDQFPEETKRLMDAPSRIAHVAKVWHQMGMRMTDPKFVGSFRRTAAAPHSLEKAAAGSIVPVSDASITNDLAYSALGGFTESESSSARCGNNIVVGFNDSGSIFETPLLLTGSGGESLSGYAYSSDGGKTFHDGGPVDPGPTLGNFLAGDPVVTCSDANTFHISQISQVPDAGVGSTTVSLSTSTDGGKTFGPPVTAVKKEGRVHLLDKSWSAVDPTNPKKIYVSYTDFDLSQTDRACGPYERIAIEFVASTDGGNTWSQPIEAREVCDIYAPVAVQGSQMVVDDNGTLFISWINLGGKFPAGPRNIEVESYAGGQLSTLMTGPSITPPGDGYLLQGDFRDFLDMSMAVDSKGLAGETLLFAFADGRDKVVPDVLSGQGFYGYSDVLLYVGIVNGSYIGFYGPYRINNDTQPEFGLGHDHYQPSIAVDNSVTYPRQYGACWYDRRADAENFDVGRYCSNIQSYLQGTNVLFVPSDVKTGAIPFTPTHDNDLFLIPSYMGDYDALSTDFLNQNPGFFSTFQVQGTQGNPNVVGFHF